MATRITGSGFEIEELQLDASSGSGSITLKSSASTSPSGTDLTLTFPQTVGSAGQFLKNTGTAGTLEFGDVTDPKYVQFKSTSTNTRTSSTSNIPFDDTTPQNTEGFEVLTLAITPTSSTNKLLIEAFIPMCDSNNLGALCLALFQDSGADAIATASNLNEAQNFYVQLGLVHIMDAGTTSETTFKIRAGSHQGTFFLNRRTSNLVYNSTMNTTLRITEIEP